MKKQKNIESYFPKIVINIIKEIKNENIGNIEDGETSIYEEIEQFIKSSTLLNELSSFKKINICISGGADGSDYNWVDNSIRNSHFSVIMSFKNHNIKIPKHKNDNLKIINLDENQIEEAIFYVKKANESLKRNIDFKKEYIKLICRDYYQIKYASSVYALGYFKNSKRENLKSVNIDGGTAWAIQMFVDNINENKIVPIYFFCLNSESWWNCEIISKNNEKTINWKRIYKIPKPKNVYAGIGSRKITKAGIEAIKEIYKQRLKF